MENRRKTGPLSLSLGLQSALHWTAILGNVFHLPWPWQLQGNIYRCVPVPGRQAVLGPSPCTQPRACAASVSHED